MNKIINHIFSINSNHLRNWILNAEGLTSLSNQSSTSEPTFKDDAIDRNIGNGYRASTFRHVFKANAGKDAPYGSTATLVRFNDCSKISTNNAERRNGYPSQSSNIIYHDSIPRYIHQAATEGPITYQQKVSVLFFQPPPVPPPGVIKTKVLTICIVLIFNYSHS